jgi:hypothetical protein
MSTDDVLLGLGLVIVLSVAFLAGIATGDVHPDALLGALVGSG